MENGKQMRFTEEELALLQGVFKGNDKLLKVLRKVFLPEYDPNSPLGQGVDLWMTVDVRNLTPEGAYVRLLARNELISHVEQQLIQINYLANMKEETVEEKEARKKADSSK
jgi:hypothetical protein